MIFIRFFMPRSWRRRQRIAYKVEKAQYADFRDARRQGRADRANQVLFGSATDIPWWRERTVGRLLARLFTGS